jgi:hypothetical protein
LFQGRALEIQQVADIVLQIPFLVMLGLLEAPATLTAFKWTLLFGRAGSAIFQHIFYLLVEGVVFIFSGCLVTEQPALCSRHQKLGEHPVGPQQHDPHGAVTARLAYAQIVFVCVFVLFNVCSKGSADITWRRNTKVRVEMPLKGCILRDLILCIPTKVILR